MTRTQYNILAQRLIRSPEQRQAVKSFMFDDVSAYAAEMKHHGRVTNTVSRDAKRLQEQFIFCLEVVNACSLSSSHA